MSVSQRIDKWLWHARLAKTRTLTAALVTGGLVRLNRARVARPSHAVRPGDIVTLALHGRVRVLRIEAIGERRGPAAEAAALYSDLSPAPAEAIPVAERPRGDGRPTKRDRRRTEAWKDILQAPDEGKI